MKVNSLFFGDLNIEEEEILVFTQGIPGFETLTKFTIIKPDDTLPIYYFQSLEEGAIAFLVTDPFLVLKDYDFELSSSTQEELKIEKIEDVAVRVVVTITSSQMNVNLLAPIIINPNQRLAKQIILHESNYKIKHELKWLLQTETQ